MDHERFRELNEAYLKSAKGKTVSLMLAKLGASYMKPPPASVRLTPSEDIMSFTSPGVHVPLTQEDKAKWLQENPEGFKELKG